LIEAEFGSRLNAETLLNNQGDFYQKGADYKKSSLQKKLEDAGYSGLYVPSNKLSFGADAFGGTEQLILFDKNKAVPTKKAFETTKGSPAPLDEKRFGVDFKKEQLEGLEGLRRKGGDFAEKIEGDFTRYKKELALEEAIYEKKKLYDSGVIDNETLNAETRKLIAAYKKAEIAKPEPTPEPVSSKTEPSAKPKTDDGTQPFDNPANLKAKPQDDALVGEGGIVMTFEDLKKDPKAAAKLARLDAGARGVASNWKAQAKAGKRLEMFGYDPVTGELSSEFQGIKTGQAGADGSADKTVTPLGMAHNADNDNLYLVGYNNNFELRTYILPEKLGDKGVSVVRPIDTPGLVGETPNPYFNAGEFADPRDYVLKLFNELPKTSIDALVRSDGKIPPQISAQIREYLVNRGDDRYEVFNFVRETMGQKEKLLAAIMDADPAIAKAVSHLASGGQTSLLKAGAEIKKASARVKALFDEVTFCG